MALSLVLALTKVLALVRNIIFSKVQVLVLNQPIILGSKVLHQASSGGHPRVLLLTADPASCAPPGGLRSAQHEANKLRNIGPKGVI